MCELCKTARPAFSRRSVMAGAASLLAASALFVNHVRAEQPETPTPPQNAISPAEALDRLMKGNARYVANTPNEKDFSLAAPNERSCNTPSLQC